MKKLKKQIKESFFSPVFQLLPLLLFLIVDDFFGLNVTWQITFPLALFLVVYVYTIYNRIFIWHLSFTLVFIIASLTACYELLIPVGAAIKGSVFEIVVLIFLFLFVILRKLLKRMIAKYMSKLIPMTNNFDEMYKFILALSLVLSVYLIAHFSIMFSSLDDSVFYLKTLRYSYVGLLVFLIIYEIIRVHIIRTKLLNEEWWPIVTDKGKVVGTIEHKTSLKDENKYMHPVVRVLLVDNGKVLLQKRSNNNIVHPGLWDTAITSHVRKGESIEQCVNRAALTDCQIKNLKYMHLSNYTVEVKDEYHYTFLFISCQLLDIKVNPTFVDQTKWWTKQQIDNDLNAGIFSENFKIEFNLLKRSGLLDTGKCECDCHLKEIVYK